MFLQLKLHVPNLLVSQAYFNLVEQVHNHYIKQNNIKVNKNHQKVSFIPQQQH